MSEFDLIAQELVNKPLMLHPASAELLIGSIRAYGISGKKADFLAPSAYTSGKQAAPYQIIQGVAVIPVYGTLLQRLGSPTPWCGCTGYDGIRLAFLAALDDPQVKGILLDVDSPGGMVAGCFDLVDTIYGARGIKPIWAVLNEVAYSAAYAIASAAEFVTVPRTGGTGSIGVIFCHVDLSKSLETQGVNISLISFGSKKTDGNETTPLSDSARKKMQADVDATGMLFCETVARNRGISLDRVIASQAEAYMGKDGISIGLADAIAAPNLAFNAMLEQLT